jgi:hypothetical protein
MKSSAILTGVLGLGLLATTPVASSAAVYAPAAQVAPSNPSVLVQYWHPGPRYVGPRYIGPRYLGPRYIGPRAGFVYSRPWVRRPYYGRIIAGVALGTIITVAAVGLIPPRPAPNLCWYWADPYHYRGYWDYCY